MNGFPDDFLLRFLQASSFNNKECIETLENYYVWQKKYLPLEITQTSFRLLVQQILFRNKEFYIYVEETANFAQSSLSTLRGFWT